MSTPKSPNKPRRNKTQREYLAAIDKHAGLVSPIARELGLTASAVRQRIAKSPKLQEAKDAVTDRALDLAEGNILLDLSNGGVQTSKWFLEQKGQDRGYGKKPREKDWVADFISRLSHFFGGGPAGVRGVAAIFGVKLPKESGGARGRSGHIVVVELDTDEVLVKRLLRGSRAGRYNLESFAGETRENVKIRWAAHVTAIIPPFQARRIIRSVAA